MIADHLIWLIALAVQMLLEGISAYMAGLQ